MRNLKFVALSSMLLISINSFCSTTIKGFNVAILVDFGNKYKYSSTTNNTIKYDSSTTIADVANSLINQAAAKDSKFKKFSSNGIEVVTMDLYNSGNYIPKSVGFALQGNDNFALKLGENFANQLSGGWVLDDVRIYLKK